MAALRRDDPRIARVVDAIAEAIAAVEAQIGRTILDEETITQRLAAKIESAVEALPLTQGARWSVQSIEADKRSENEHGADLGVVVDLALPAQGNRDAYNVSKGVVLQMKRHDRLSAELAKLRRQCADMKTYTSAAGAVVLRPDGSFFVPAADVTGVSTVRELTLRGRPLKELFIDALVCDEGDEQLGRPDLMLHSIHPRLSANRVVRLEARPVMLGEQRPDVS